jgi:hypothetical protein
MCHMLRLVAAHVIIMHTQHQTYTVFAHELKDWDAVKSEPCATVYSLGVGGRVHRT